jgi:uncharacterized YceG family protein
MSDRWFSDIPEHDPDDPAAVERERRRRERLEKRSQAAGGKRGRTGLRPPRREGRTRPGRTLRGGGSRGGGGDRRRLFALAGAGLVAVLGIVFLFSLFQPFAGDPSGEKVPIKVPEGAGVGEIGDLLAENGVISNPTLFEIRARISGRAGELYFGNHVFYRDMSYDAALDELGRQPKKETISIVIPEGLSRSETADTVRAAGLPGDYMKATVESKDLDPNDYGAQGRAENLEGFLFPATYELDPGSDVSDLVAQQLQAFKDNVAGVNLRYAKSKNLTLYDVLTIASMVEREVSVAKERPIVSAVIYNRLQRGEPLFIDATTRFALDNWTEPLTESDLAVDSPYNTRTNAGLPPGPIGSPGLASIEAAAKPADTDVWLYVVKPGTCGEHDFSNNLDDHNRKVAAYQEAQAAAGGSPTECP